HEPLKLLDDIALDVFQVLVEHLHEGHGAVVLREAEASHDPIAVRLVEGEDAVAVPLRLAQSFDVVEELGELLKHPGVRVVDHGFSFREFAPGGDGVGLSAPGMARTEWTPDAGERQKGFSVCHAAHIGEVFSCADQVWKSGRSPDGFQRTILGPDGMGSLSAGARGWGLSGMLTARAEGSLLLC